MNCNLLVLISLRVWFLFFLQQAIKDKYSQAYY